MRRLFTLGVTAILAIAFAVGATTAFAGGKDGGGGGGGGGGGEKGEKGNACPPPTPGFGREPPPGCGHDGEDGKNGNGGNGGNGDNGDGAACTAAGHPPVEEFGPISGPLHDNIGDEFPEPLGGSIHYALCAVANLGL